MDFVRIPETDEVLSRKDDCLICAEPGDLIVWDSRTIHCNSPALATPQTLDENNCEQAPWDLIRMVGYICMTPVSWAKESVLVKRWEAFAKNMSTSHWPHEFTSGTMGSYDLPMNDFNTTSPIQRKLIGGNIDPVDALGDLLLTNSGIAECHSKTVRFISDE